MIDAERLATNLLSSMPLTFNLLAPWMHALERASGYLIELLPAFTGTARQSSNICPDAATPNSRAITPPSTL